MTRRTRTTSSRTTPTKASLLCLLTSLLPFATPTYGAQPQNHFRNHPDPECLHSATSLTLNALLRTQGAGARIALCPFAQVSIDPHGPPITFTAPNQALFTAGLPEDHTRATVTISHPRGHLSGELTTAIRADCAACEGVKVTHIMVDGGRNELGGVEGGDALILIGGAKGEQQVSFVEAYNARGYAVLHASEGPKATCTGVTVTDNTFHSSGDAPLDLMLNSELVRLRDGPPPYRGQDRPGHWTDGISIACAQSSITDNTLRDLTGVAIALRGAPGAQVLQNTITARDRDMLVGIAAVANPAFRSRPDHNDGIVIRENTVHAASAMIRVGISLGAGAWSNDEDEKDLQVPFGSEVARNRLSSYTGYFGYAIAISDAKSVVVISNAVSASVWGFQTPSCLTKPVFPLPAPLIRDTRSVMGQLQPEFRPLHFGFLLCVGPGAASESLEISRHQINEKYIEQVATRSRTMRGLAAKRDDTNRRRTLATLQRKKNGLRGRGGREGLFSGGEDEAGEVMRKRTLMAPRRVGGSGMRRSS